MEDRKESGGSRKRPLVVGVLGLLVLGAALALVSASSGSTSKPQTAAAKPVVVVSTGKGFGEVYAAKRSTLAHTLFKAKLIPKPGMSNTCPCRAALRSTWSCYRRPRPARRAARSLERASSSR